MIKTAHLELRLLQKNDLDFLDLLENDPEVKQFFPGGARDRDKTAAMTDRFIACYQEKGLPCFVIFEKATGNFVGRAGFGLTETEEIEIGYVLHKQFWGKGYASEVLATLLEWAKKHIPTPYIIAYADPRNRGSIRVMEKCGMTYYKTQFAQGLSCQFYRIKNED